MTAMDMRMFDSAIARWVVLDPVVHHGQTPYNGFDGNPVYWADPSGADGTNYSGEGFRGSTYDYQGRPKYNDGGFYIPAHERGMANYHYNPNGMYANIGTTDRPVLLGDTVGQWIKVKVGQDVSYAKDNGDSLLEEIIFKNIYEYDFVENAQGNGGGMGNRSSAWDLGSGFAGTYLDALDNYATNNASYVYRYGARGVSAASLTTANTARMLNIAKRAQILGNTLGFVAGGISLYNAEMERRTTGNINYKNYTDGIVGIAGASAGTAMMFGVLASNPIGWAVLGGIATGAAIYGVVSFSIDVYNANK